MLIRFRSTATGSIVMFGDAAKRLLVMMGQSGESPGAILAKDLPAAVERLKEALAQDRAQPQPPTEEEGRGEGPAVSLSQRAVPLIHLLEEAARAGADVTWGQ
jgi:hypothetical protein